MLVRSIAGPNVPKMLGLGGHRRHVEEGRIYPAIGHSGVKVISMAFLLEDEDTPVVWRGPIKLGAIQQFLGDVEWGELDYLVIDFPPGTSDEPLTVVQSLPNIDGMVIVTTPQDVALLDSRKSIGFATSLKVPVLGVVENMSGYTIRGTAEPNAEMKIEAPGGGKVDVVADAEPPVTGEAEIVGELRRWHALTFIFTGPSHAETDSGPNPFLDYRFTMTFTAPSGASLVAPGFFAGDGSGGRKRGDHQAIA